MFSKYCKFQISLVGKDAPVKDIRTDSRKADVLCMGTPGHPRSPTSTHPSSPRSCHRRLSALAACLAILDWDLPLDAI